MTSYDNGLGLWLIIGVFAHLLAKKKPELYGKVRFYQICYWLVFFSLISKIFLIESGDLVTVKATFVIVLFIAAIAAWYQRNKSPHWKIVLWMSAITGIGNVVSLFPVLPSIVTDFALGGTIWVVAAFVAERFAGDKEMNKPKYYAVLVASILVIVFIKNAYVVPTYNERYKAREAEQILIDDEPYSTLKTTFPDEHNKMREAVIEAVKNNASKEQISNIFKDTINTAVFKKLKYASDEALIAMVRSSTSISEHFINIGQPENVYNYMFNTKELPLNWWKSLPKNIADGQTNAYKLVLLSAAQGKEYKIDEQRANKVLEGVAATMYAKYGEQFTLLENGATHPDKKREIGEMTVDMYKYVFKLNERDQALVLRLMLAGS